MKTRKWTYIEAFLELDTIRCDDQSPLEEKLKLIDEIGHWVAGKRWSDRSRLLLTECHRLYHSLAGKDAE